MQYCKIFRKSKFKDTGQQYSKIGIVKIRNVKLEMEMKNTISTFPVDIVTYLQMDNTLNLRR